MASSAARRAAVAASLALFAISLFLPAFSTAPGDQGSPGILVIVVGWLGLIASGESPANLAWLANAALLASWILCRAHKRWPATTASLLGLGLAALPFATRQVAVDEAGYPRAIVAFGLGYGAWCGAMAAAVVAAFLTPVAADVR